MSDLANRVRAIGERIDAGYHERRTEAALAGLLLELRRRRARRFAAASAVGALCLIAGAYAVVRHHQGRTRALVAKPGALFALSDGSVVTPLDPTTRLVAKTVSPGLVELELLVGSAHFEVAPNRARTFRVSAGEVAVEVVGTKFSVERLGKQTAVAVQSGRVRIAWARGQQVLDPGERGIFPPFEPALVAGPPAEPVQAAPNPVAPTIRPQAAPVRATGDWRVPAQRGDWASSYRLLHDKAKLTLPASADDLLLAADVARGSGHAREAASYLEKALATHAQGPSAAVVAFTLGRVRLADLDDPAGAAAAFAQSRSAAPQGPLAEDALAREIECRFRAGDQARARALAEEYERLWPAGAHERAIRHFGGLP